MKARLPQGMGGGPQNMNQVIRQEQKIREDAEQHAIFFRSNYDEKHFPRVEQLVRYLNQGRNPALEESYWGLAGGGDLQDESEMLLIGAMIDHADIKIADGYVTFYLYRNRG